MGLHCFLQKGSQCREEKSKGQVHNSQDKQRGIADKEMGGGGGVEVSLWERKNNRIATLENKREFMSSNYPGLISFYTILAI